MIEWYKYLRNKNCSIKFRISVGLYPTPKLSNTSHVPLFTYISPALIIFQTSVNNNKKT